MERKMDIKISNHDPRPGTGTAQVATLVLGAVATSLAITGAALAAPEIVLGAAAASGVALGTAYFGFARQPRPGSGYPASEGENADRTPETVKSD